MLNSKVKNTLLFGKTTIGCINNWRAMQRDVKDHMILSRTSFIKDLEIIYGLNSLKKKNYMVW